MNVVFHMTKCMICYDSNQSVVVVVVEQYMTNFLVAMFV